MEGYYFDHALLISCIDGLGRFGGQSVVYEKELDTVNCLKDIDRFLRRDFEDTKEALLTLGKCNVVSQNLLPLLKTYPSDQDILYHTMRVLVLMSMPPQGSYPSHIKDIHHTIKAEFTNTDALAILMSMCHEPLSHFDDLSDAHYNSLQMFISFIRNMMLIPDSEDCGNATARHHYSTLQVDFLRTAFQENVLELVGLIAQHMGTKVLKADAPVMLDLLHGIYASFDPKSVLNADESILLNRTKARSATAEDLQRSHPEPSQFLIKTAKPVHTSINHIQTSKTQPRHAPNNPGLRLMSHSGEHAFYVKTVPGTFGQVVLKNAARTKAAAKVQATVNASVAPVPKTTNILLLATVKVYTSQLLRGAFNAVMNVACDEASLGLNVCSMPGKSMLRFFKLAAWFMQYCRYQEEVRAKQVSKSKPEKLQVSASSLYQRTSSILCWKMIHAVLRVWLEMIDTDGKLKKETEWGLQEASIKVLKEALSLLDLAFHYGSQDDKKVADMLQRRLLQDETKEAGILNRISQCMRQFKKHDKRIARQEGRETRAYAIDMVKTMHIVLRVYSRLCQESFSVMRSSNRRSAARKKKTMPADEPAEGINIPDVIYPGQAKSWQCAGNSDADGGGTGDDKVSHAAGDADAERGKGSKVEVDDDEDGAAQGDPEDHIEESVSHRKVEFAAVLKTASHIEILKLYMFLLEKYKALDAATLHAIATYLGRLCNELRLEPMLYQVSYLKQFHVILSDETIKNKPIYGSLKKVASRVASHLIARLDPKPVSVPGLPVTNDQEGSDNATDQQKDENPPGAVHDEVLGCLPAHSRHATMLKIQDRVTKLLFVELLFEKGPRESEMIQAEYSWRKALLDRTEGREDQLPVPDVPDDDEHLRDAPHQNAGRQVDSAADDSDEEDALPQPGAEKQAPHLPSKGLAAGLQMTAEEQHRFKALFETVNGSRSARQLLLAEWNQQEELQLTTKQAAHTMAALNLRPGELTQEQEERLALMLEEFGHHGRRAYKRIANAFPGGFSSAAIKKLMTRLKLTLRASGEGRRTLEDLEGSDDDIAGAQEQVARQGQSRKRSRHRPKTVAASQEDEEASSDSHEDDDAPNSPAAKRRRSSLEAPPVGDMSSAMEENGSGGEEDEQTGDMLGLEDDVATQKRGAAARALDSSDDDWGMEGATVQGRDRIQEGNGEMHNPENTDLPNSKCGADPCTNTGVTNRGKAAAPKKPKKSAAKLKKAPEKCSQPKRPHYEEPGMSGMPTDTAATTMLDVHAVEAAARLVKNELREDGDYDVTAEDIVTVVADLLAGSLAETSSQGTNQVQLSICPETDAEEQIMSMPATEALLESLGLHFSGGDDLSTWLVDGAVHELQDRLVSLLDAALMIADKHGGRHPGSTSDDLGDTAMLQDDEVVLPGMAGLLDDDDDEPGVDQSVDAAANKHRPKLKMARLSDVDGDSSDEDAQHALPATTGVPHEHDAGAGLSCMEDCAIDENGDDLPASDQERRSPADVAAAEHRIAPEVHGNVHVQASGKALPNAEDAVPADSENSPSAGPVAPTMPAACSSMHTCAADATGGEGAPVADALPSPYKAASADDTMAPASSTDDPVAALPAIQPEAALHTPVHPGLASSSAVVEPPAADGAVPQDNVMDSAPPHEGEGVEADLQGVASAEAAPAEDAAIQEIRPDISATEALAVEKVQGSRGQVPPDHLGAPSRDAFGRACEQLPQARTVEGDAAGPDCSSAPVAITGQEPGAAADDMSPQLAPTGAVERLCGDVDMMTPVISTLHSGPLNSRSATRSVTFSEITTDLASGPTHEWQGGRAKKLLHKGEGGEEGQLGAPRLPRPALKPWYRAIGSGQSMSEDSPPLELVGQNSAADLPPSFGISPDNETAAAPGGSRRLIGLRVPLSPIKATPMRGHIDEVPSKDLAAAAVSVPGSQGRRPRTKKARLEAMQASQESGRSPTMLGTANGTSDQIGKTSINSLNVPGSQGESPRMKKAHLEAMHACQQSGPSPEASGAASANSDKPGKKCIATPPALATRTENVSH